MFLSRLLTDRQRRYSSDEQGVTAIEFSLLALPFMLFIVGIIEMAVYIVACVLVQGAVGDATRLIRTGQVQEATSDPEELFRTALCDHGSMLLNCDRLQYHVEVLDAFADAEVMPEFDEEGNMLETSFDPGGVSDVVMVRVAYLYPFMTPFIGDFFANNVGNTRLIMATTVFESEPYDFE